MPKKAATVAAADTPTLAPSAPEEVDDFVVSVLRARQDWLELWTERLREWLAGRVLQPLVAAVQGAHEPVNTVRGGEVGGAGGGGGQVWSDVRVRVAPVLCWVCRWCVQVTSTGVQPAAPVAAYPLLP